MNKFIVVFAALVAVAAGLSLSLTGGDAEAQDLSDNAIPNQYIVIVRGDVDPGAAALSAGATHGAQVLHVYRHAINGFSFRGSAVAADALARNPNIVSVTPDHKLSAVAPKKCEKNANAPGCGGEDPPAESEILPTGVDRIDADLTVTANSNPATVAVAVLDSGIDTDHPDLNVVGGANFVGGISYDDDFGHGTHVAGTIGAVDNELGVIGVAPGTPLYAVKVLNGGGGGSDATIIGGINWVMAQGNIKVINMSLGGFGFDVDGPLRQAIDAAVASGIVVVVAAGNEASDAATFVPAAYDSVITVSAIDDGNGSFASFSNWGADVDLAAPGVGINSTTVGGGTSGDTWNGTSMASPHVAGAVALYLANNSGALPADVKDYLILTGEPAPDGGWPGDPDDYAERLVDAQWADPAVALPNFTPWVQISDPTGDPIALGASATDYEDGAISGDTIDWYLDGILALADSATYPLDLPDGTYTIKAVAMDSAGATGSASRTVVVGFPTFEVAVDVATDKATYRNHKQVIITVSVSLGGFVPAAGADVHLDLFTASGAHLVGNRLTDSFGNAGFSYRVDARNHGYGTYTVDASAVLAPFGSDIASTTFEVVR